MKIILEDVPENTEIKISCNDNQSQDVSISTNGRDISQAILKAVCGNDEES